MKNKFIVVVPLYNAEKWIGKCLRSLSLQTYKNYECVVIDDCSSDNSFNIAKKTVEQDKRFVLVRTSQCLQRCEKAILLTRRRCGYFRW